VCRYADYELTPEGLQYKDLQVGTGRTIQEGDNCVLDWQGMTPISEREEQKSHALKLGAVTTDTCCQQLGRVQGTQWDTMDVCLKLATR
jgi:hypothetical protein